MHNKERVRIFICPFGSMGDIYEHLMVALEQMRLGREVLFVCDRDNANFVASFGVPIMVIPEASPSGILAEMSQGDDMLKMLREVTGLLRPVIPPVVRSVRQELIRFKPHLAIDAFSSGMFVGPEFYKQRIPLIQLDPYMSPEPAPYPCMVSPFIGLESLNWMTGTGAEAMFWYLVERLSAKVSGVFTLPGTVRRWSLKHIVASPWLVYANKPPQDRRKLKLTDYILPPKTPGGLPADIAAHFEAHKAEGVTVIALGSIDLSPANSLALRQLIPQLGPTLIIGGYGALTGDLANNTVKFIPHLPYQDLKGQPIKAGVLSGAIGGLAHFGALGAPQVVFPKLAEQQLRAKRVEKLGIGVYIKSVDELPAALQKAKGLQQSAQARAKDFGHRGSEQVNAHIEATLQSLNLV